ncbi:MAG TPA: hypothetical protein VFU19_17190 [Iamia sp.]|nr:hypothetical protein [Iamia sp.]
MGWRPTSWMVATGVPVAVVVVGGWQRRWISDDGFINFRVIDQVLAGHGPVFNQGERVEVTTSTLWPLLLGVLHAVTGIRLEWLAIGCGLAGTALAVVVGMHGARRLNEPEPEPESEPGRRTWWLPAGALVFVALPVVWDFVTSGLENPLSWLWWAAAFAIVVDVTGPSAPTAARRRRLVGAAVVGLGPLVRPDLALPAAVFLAAMAWTEGQRAGTRRAAIVRVGWMAVAAGAAPTAYQVLRMGYYGQLLPNTVYAKEGGKAWWSQGWRYLGDLVGTYGLWVPLVAAGVAVALTVERPARGRSSWTTAVVATEGAALAHALLIVRAGGDYMHGRLLLPALFGLLLPAFAVPVRARRGAALAPLAVLALWVAFAVGRESTGQPLDDAVFDFRRFTIENTGTATPILVEDHLAWLDERGIDVATLGRDGPPRWWPEGPDGPTVAPLAPGQPSTVSTGAIGALPFALPLEVRVADQLGLADPVVAHLRLAGRGLPGHEKSLRRTWWAARLLPPGQPLPPDLDLGGVVAPHGPSSASAPADVGREQADAAAALGCGELVELRAATTDPLTPGRVARNLVGALGLHTFRFDPDPATARADLCD